MNLNTLIARLAKIQRNQRLAIYAVFYFLLILAYWGALYLPHSSSHDALKKKSNELTTQLETLKIRATEGDRFRAELAQLMADLDFALKELPEDREIPNLLKGISATGKKVGLEVRRFQPLAENMREYVAEIPVSLEVEGSYHEVAMFFDRLSKMNRIVYIQDIEMSTPEERGGKVYLKVSGKAVTFRFLSDEEIKAQQEMKANQDKRGGKNKQGKK